MNKQKIFKKHSYKTLVIVFLLLGVALSLRTLNIDREFAGDESATMSIASLKQHLITAELKKREIYPPATYFILSYWMKISTSTSWIRFYFVLFGVGVCVLIYLIAREYFNEKLAKHSSFNRGVFSSFNICISIREKLHGFSFLDAFILSHDAQDIKG